MSHPLESQRARYPHQVSEEYHTGVTPPLDVSKTIVSLLIGRQEQTKTPRIGDASLLLSYKGKEVAIISYLARLTDLQIVQLQGATSRKSYRGHTGIEVAQLFADETIQLIQHSPQLERITVLKPQHNLDLEATDDDDYSRAADKFLQMIKLLEMMWSEEERQYVRELH